MSTVTPGSVAILDRADAMEAIAGEWEELGQSDRDAAPFDSPQWLLPWWTHFAEGKELVVITARDAAGRLTLVAPFCVDRGTAMLLGTGNSDRLGILGDASTALAILCERGGWNVADLQLLRRSAPLALAPLPHGFVSETIDGEVWPVAPLPAPLSTHFRTRLRADARKLEAAGAIRVEEAHDETSAARALDVLARLHAARWSRVGQGGVLGEERTRAFHRDVVAACARRGMLRMFLLCVGARPAAAYYGFRLRDVAYYYLGAFDPDVAHIGIGNLLVAHAMESARNEGATRFDFLRGREAYKYRWGAQDEPAVRRRVGRAGAL